MIITKLLPLALLLIAGCQSLGSPAAGTSLLAHDVYFALVDDSPEARNKLVTACEEKLAPLPGIAFFAAGSRNASLMDEVNDLDYDVSLHVYFENRTAYDAYLIAPDHLAFIDMSKANWAGVRVFDSRVTRR